MSQLIVGDIHGCYAEFMELLDQAALAADDAIIALGDIVDRGPDSASVLAFFRAQPRARSIQGNHERKHFRSLRREIKPARSQIITRQELGAGYAEVVAFMETLPPSLELPAAALVHGFWEPGKTLAEQPVNVSVGTLGGEHYLAQHYAQPWYELYDGPLPLIVGHHDYRRDGQPFIYQDRVFALDTSCVHGKRLTGLLLPEFRLVSVASRADHWAQTRARWKATQPKPFEPPPWDAAAESRLEQLYRQITQQHAQALAELRAAQAYDGLSPHDQARVYAAHIGATPLGRYLHHLRQGRLSLADLRRHLGHPGRLEQLERRLNKTSAAPS